MGSFVDVVPSNIKEIVPDLIGTNGLFISIEYSFMRRSNDSASISELVYGA